MKSKQTTKSQAKKKQVPFESLLLSVAFEPELLLLLLLRKKFLPLICQFVLQHVESQMRSDVGTFP